MKSLRFILHGLLCLQLCLVSSTSAASGFAIFEQGVKGLGSSFSNTAENADASVIFFNAGGLGFLDETSIQAAGHVIAPSGTFTDAGSTINPAVGGGSLAPTATNAGGDAAVVGLIPNLYVHHRLRNVLDGNWHIGVGINAPFALKTNYDDNWIGRYHALTSSIQTININPTVAYNFNDVLSVGFGLNAQRVEARLTNALDQSTSCLALAAAGAIAGATCVAQGLATPASLTSDATLDLRRAEDWSPGWNAGFMLQPSANTRLGFHYRSKTEHTLEGTAVFNNVNPVLAATTVAVPGVTGLVTQSFSADLTLPESASLHLYHRFANSRWAVHGDTTWTRWSQFDQLVVQFADGTSAVQPENWKNTWRFSGGLTYYHNTKWTFRAGAAFDETPIPNAVFRTPRLPDADRTWLSVGASYQIADRWSVDAGYVHLFVKDATLANTEVFTGHTLTGSNEADVNIASLQVNYQW